MASADKIDKLFFDRIPAQPGVYVMKDAAGEVVYVGKAKNLRTRVRQYFRPGGDTRLFVAAGFLERVLAEVDTIVVANEKEALLLENHLIKQHQPRFNINLRDDKQYLVLRVDPASRYPRVEVVRNIAQDGARYFGPYHSATSARATLRTLNRHFQLRTCTDHVLATRKRPCLQYQIKRCPGPCVFPVDEAAYAEQVNDVCLFLSGRSDELSQRLRARMVAAAESERYEAAAQARDALAAVDRSLTKQNVVQDRDVDQDVFAVARAHDRVECAILFVRAGKLIGRRAVHVREQYLSDEEVLAAIVQQYYASGTFVPQEVLCCYLPDGAPLLGEWLSGLRGSKVHVLSPQRSQRARLVALAVSNAQAQLETQIKAQDVSEVLHQLKDRLQLPAPPQRIECFDIAHTQGSATVASMAVLRDGKPDKSAYRRFRVRHSGNDDFASMYEVLSRRIRRGIGEDKARWPLPDLIVIDGGKGQLASAEAAIADVAASETIQLQLRIVALAKPMVDSDGTAHPDRVFLPGQKNPLTLPARSAELHLLMHVRDEAHRFANSFHNAVRKKRVLTSVLDQVAGIGSKRRVALLRHFGDVHAIARGDVAEIARVAGLSQERADQVRADLRQLLHTPA